MTVNAARTIRLVYLTMGSLALVSGTLILLVTALMGVSDRYLGFGAGNIKKTADWIYEHGMVGSWLWPWMSDNKVGGTFNMLFSSSALLGLALIAVATLLLRNAARLKRWTDDVKELLVKLNVDGSRLPSHITQQLADHYKERPDNPTAPFIAAIAGAAAVIAASLLRVGQ